MIIGILNESFEPSIPLLCADRNGRWRRITVAIDTGFSGFLTLHPDIIAELEGFRFGTTRFEVADGSEIEFPTFTMKVQWDGFERRIVALASEAGSLVGMKMIKGWRLQINAVEGGDVRIERL